MYHEINTKFVAIPLSCCYTPKNIFCTSQESISNSLRKQSIRKEFKQKEHYYQLKRKYKIATTIQKCLQKYSGNYLKE